MAVANAVFRREGVEQIGRQSQMWVKFEDGWKVVSAHVSLVDIDRPQIRPGAHSMIRFGKGLRLALIGFGAIAEEIVRCLDNRGESESLPGVLDLPQRMPEVRIKQRAGSMPLTVSTNCSRSTPISSSSARDTRVSNNSVQMWLRGE